MKINFNQLWDLLFPKKCINCQRPGSYLCKDCLSLISINEFSICPFCSQRTSHYDCCQQHREKNIDQLHFATSYNQPLVKKIINKYIGSPFIQKLAPSLAFLIIAHFKLISESPMWNNVILIPFPLSSRRERYLGFHPHRKIVQQLSSALNIPTVSQPKKLRSNQNKEQYAMDNPALILNKKVILVKLLYQQNKAPENLATWFKKKGADTVAIWSVARRFP